MRDVRTISWLETTWHDLRYGVRKLGKTSVLVTVAVLSLGLGVGANTAIFTLINAVMLQSLSSTRPMARSRSTTELRQSDVVQSARRLSPL